MGKTKDGKNPFYKGEAGICKYCKKPQPSILRHLAQNKTHQISYTVMEINELHCKSQNDPKKLDRIRARRKARYIRDKRKKEQSKQCDKLKSEIPFINNTINKKDFSMVDKTLSNEITQKQNNTKKLNIIIKHDELASDQENVISFVDEYVPLNTKNEYNNLYRKNKERIKKLKQKHPSLEQIFDICYLVHYMEIGMMKMRQYIGKVNAMQEMKKIYEDIKKVISEFQPTSKLKEKQENP